MAKESMKAREVKRAKLVAKYAEKRAALKQIVRTGDPAEAFAGSGTRDTGTSAENPGSSGSRYADSLRYGY